MQPEVKYLPLGCFFCFEVIRTSKQNFGSCKCNFTEICCCIKCLVMHQLDWWPTNISKMWPKTISVNIYKHNTGVTANFISLSHIFFTSYLRVVSLFQSTNYQRKSQNFVRTFFFFLRFVLNLPTPELKCHLVPFAVSLCVFIIQPTAPRWCASQQAQYRASNLFICGEKGQAYTLATMLEVLYLSTGPNI